MKNQKRNEFLTAALVAAFFGAIWCIERLKPLRREVELKGIRTRRNLAIAALSTLALQTAERPVTRRLTREVETKSLGLLKTFKLPSVLESFLGVVLLDYTLYHWHVLTHKVPLLWRFHKVHHADLDLDASTGLRFHFGEMLLSVFFRALQIRSLGINAKALWIWNVALLIEVLFHHSNIRLPLQLERCLSRLIVTPRLHGIHHSTRFDEMDSNWSSGLTVWDFLHGTYRDNVPQREIVIGIPEVRSPDQATLPRMLLLPFRDQITAAGDAEEDFHIQEPARSDGRAG